MKKEIYPVLSGTKDGLRKLDILKLGVEGLREAYIYYHVEKEVPMREIMKNLKINRISLTRFINYNSFPKPFMLVRLFDYALKHIKYVRGINVEDLVMDYAKNTAKVVNDSVDCRFRYNKNMSRRRKG